MFIEARRRPFGADLTPAALLLMNSYVHMCIVHMSFGIHTSTKRLAWHIRFYKYFQRNGHLAEGAALPIR
jgi:hypothetical protein